MSEKIIFNGRLYYGPNEMDSKTRTLYERLDSFLKDRNRDGVPDVLQEGGVAAIKQAFKFMKDLSAMGEANLKGSQTPMSLVKISDTAISVNGRTFRDVKEMPPEVRKIYQGALTAAGESGPVSVEIFDEPWRERERDSYFEPHDDENIQPQYRQSNTPSVMEPVTSNLGLVIALVLASVFIAIGALIWISGGNLF